ncbi:MAG: efflux RND transporter permease subunit [Thermoanaerobaculia bacterium]
MTLYALAIRRPVLAWVLSITIVLFGILGFTRLGVREFPSVDPPIITVSTNYVGANADVIQAQVTEPLEEAVNSVDGIRTLTSVSRAGRSTVRVEFDLDADLERAANDVRDKVSRALGNLPPDVDPPEVSKADADAPPIVMLWVRSDGRDLSELSRLAQDVFAERLQTIEGVSQIDIWGEREPAMRIWLDPQRLAAYRLSPLDVRDAVQRENVELPSGRIEGDTVELAVRTLSRLNTPEEYGNLILKQDGSRIVRLADVGRAELGPRNPRTVLKNDGVPMVAVVARPQPGANYVAIADAFYQRVEQIRRDLPQDVEIGYGFDTTRFIRRSIAEVVETIFVAFLLVIAVIFAFLRDWRTTVIPVLVIPVSLIGAFAVMWAAGFSINVLTLLALVLAIGLVVDDAIVVLENVYSKVESGLEPAEAGIAGTREIFFAVIATTLALISVLLPLFFLGGLTGRLFREFGATLAGAVAISSFVALTLTSMLSSRVLKRRQRHPWLYRATEPFFRRLIDGYRRALTRFLTRRWLVLPIFAVCLALIVLFLGVLPSELAPLEDRSGIRLGVTGPEGATFEYMDAYMDGLIRTVRDEVPEHQVIITVTSPGFGATSATNTGFMRLVLTEPAERERSQQEIAEALEPRIARLTRARANLTQDPTISVGGSRGLPVQFVLQAPTLGALEEALPRFLDEANGHPAFLLVEEDLKFTNPELRVSIDRARARDLGVSARAVGETLQLALSEQRIGFFLLGGKQYEVISQVTQESRVDPTDLRNLFVPSSSGEPVLLDRLVTVTEESRPPQLYRFDRFASAIVSAALAPGYTLGDGIAAMREVADRVLDDSFSTALTGQSRDFEESSRALLFVFLLALALIYLVLAAQFESFRDPLTIMLTVPLAVIGALGSLWYFGQTLNLFSQIGIIMLIGLVTKNGILIVEFANQRRAAGLSIHDAVIDAAAARFRPVLMTTLSTVLGILPIALALGAGSESRVPMGIAVIGGLLLGTALTLFVVPAVYTYLTRKTLTAAGAEAPRVGEAA